MMNVFSLVLLDFLFFVCNTYPKHIIEVGDRLSTISVFFNLMFYFIFALFLIIAFSKGKNFFSDGIFPKGEKLTRKIELKKILCILSVKIVFDIIVLFSNKVYIYDFITIAVWILVYNICAPKVTNVLRHKKKYILIIAFVILLTVTGCVNYNIFVQSSIIADKYYPNSDLVQQHTINLEFMFGVKNFIIDIISGSILLVAHSTFNRTEKNISETNRDKKDRISVNIIRCVLLILACLIVVILKFNIFPDNGINNWRGGASIEQHKYSSEAFYACRYTKQISRFGGGLQENRVFHILLNELYYDGDLIYKYYSSDEIAAHMFESQENTIYVTAPFEESRIGDITFWVYKKDVICFLNDGEPTCIHKDDRINIAGDQLTEIYKSLIKDNNWEFFKQAAEYLLRYDETFIRPYLERYSLGQLEEQEYQSLKEMEINREYIQQVSTVLVSKME